MISWISPQLKIFKQRSRKYEMTIEVRVVIGAGALYLLIIYNLSLCSAQLQKPELLNQPTQNEGLTIGLREKRQTQTTYAKNKYESVSQNSTTIDGQQQKTDAATASNVSSIVVQYNTGGERPLLGVNGTGQRKTAKDTLQSAKPAIISDAVQSTQVKIPTAITLSANKPTEQLVETSAEQVIDTIDVPDNETLSEIEKHNLSINTTTDYHTYYNSSIYKDKAEADKVWDVVKNTTPNSMLSQSHRRAMTVELTFDFPFYGHPVRNVTVATGGFLYTGEYVHSWLAATQYIAPLMANFDTSLSNESFVRIKDNGTAFTVIWEKVSLQDKQDVGKFTFSATLHKNGDIVFIYYSVPIDINSIQDDKHPVKVGLSDAYIIDKTVFYTRRKTIYEYHRINFGNTDIANSTIIYLQALPTCLDYKDCASCSNHNTSFDCAWCPALNRCSTGTDRRKQEWLQKGCDKTQISDAAVCPPLGQRGNNANQANGSDNNNNELPSVVPNNNNSDASKSSSNSNSSEEQQHKSEANNASVMPSNGNVVEKAANEALEAPAEPKSMGLALGFLIPICLIVTAMLWVLYAYKNPHTKSGQLLIQYRPSQWSWRRGEARYTAATIHM